MKKKIRKLVLRNPVAEALANPKFKQKVVPNKKRRVLREIRDKEFKEELRWP